VVPLVVQQAAAKAVQHVAITPMMITTLPKAALPATMSTALAQKPAAAVKTKH
jgi:hypothetical protein